MQLLLIGHGYVGSYLSVALEGVGHHVVVCDQNLGQSEGLNTALRCRYQELSIGDLNDFDVILWFAGHSSVSKSVADPEGAVANNCLDLLQFARRRPARMRLFYASTASIYSTEHSENASQLPPELCESETRLDPRNPYDCSKISFDALARCFVENVVGLRLGTVCGYGPNMRGELIFNAMNRTAIDEGRVLVSNRQVSRNILFLDDLANYICALIEVDGPLPSILNTGSMNLTIGELAETVAEFYNVPIIAKPDTKTYSFRMDCRLLESLCGQPRAVSLFDRCAEFESAYRPRAVRTAL